MPRLTFPIARVDLAVPVYIGQNANTMAAWQATGRPLPPVVTAQGLLDTGTDVTAIAGWIRQRLAIPKATTAITHTASGMVTVDFYEVSLSITNPGQPRRPKLTEPNLLVTELPTTLPDADVLIDLDVMLKCDLLVKGTARWFAIDF